MHKDELGGFGEALECLRDGSKIAREGWNGKGMFLFLVDRGLWDLNDVVGVSTMDLYPSQFAPFIAMKTADDKLVPWLASQTDILANDWVVVG